MEGNPWASYSLGHVPDKRPLPIWKAALGLAPLIGLLALASTDRQGAAGFVMAQRLMHVQRAYCLGAGKQYYASYARKLAEDVPVRERPSLGLGLCLIDLPRCGELGSDRLRAWLRAGRNNGSDAITRSQRYLTLNRSQRSAAEDAALYTHAARGWIDAELCISGDQIRCKRVATCELGPYRAR